MSISFLKHWLNEHYQQSGPGFVPGSWPHGCTLANKLRTRQDRVQEKWPSSNIMNSNRVHKLLQNCLRNGDVELLTLDTRTCNFHLDSDSRSYKETVKKSITNYNHPNWTELKHHHSWLSFYSFLQKSCYIMASIFVKSTHHKPANTHASHPVHVPAWTGSRTD